MPWSFPVLSCWCETALCWGLPQGSSGSTVGCADAGTGTGPALGVAPAAGLGLTGDVLLAVLSCCMASLWPFLYALMHGQVDAHDSPLDSPCTVGGCTLLGGMAPLLPGMPPAAMLCTSSPAPAPGCMPRGLLAPMLYAVLPPQLALAAAQVPLLPQQLLHKWQHLLCCCKVCCRRQLQQMRCLWDWGEQLRDLLAGLSPAGL